jgi:hypothetical protein
MISKFDEIKIGLIRWKQKKNVYHQNQPKLTLIRGQKKWNEKNGHTCYYFFYSC